MKAKKLLSVILAVAMMLSIMPATVLAASTQRTTALDLTTQQTADNLAAEGWAWNAETKTLTLDGLDLSVSSGHAVTVPDGTSIVIAAGSVNTVKTQGSKANGICALGSLTITGSDSENTGTLNITTPYRGIEYYLDSAAAKGASFRFFNMNLNITGDRGIVVFYKGSNGTGADTDISIDRVTYTHIYNGSNNKPRTLQIWTTAGNAALNIENSTVLGDGDLVVHAESANSVADMTVINSTLSAGAYNGGGGGIAVGDNKSTIARATFSNSTITAIDNDNSAFLVNSSTGTCELNATNSDFFIADPHLVTSVPTDAGNSVTYLYFASKTSYPESNGDIVTAAAPANSTITVGNTVYKIPTDAANIACNMATGVMNVPAGTALETAGGNTVVSDGELTFVPGAEPVMQANAKTTITTAENEVVSIVPAGNDVLHIDGAGSITIPAGAEVRIGDGEAVVYPYGGVLDITNGVVTANPDPAPTPDPEPEYDFSDVEWILKQPYWPVNSDSVFSKFIYSFFDVVVWIYTLFGIIDAETADAVRAIMLGNA